MEVISTIYFTGCKTSWVDGVSTALGDCGDHEYKLRGGRFVGWLAVGDGRERGRGIVRSGYGQRPYTIETMHSYISYIYVMFIWAVPFPADRWHCSQWP